MKKRVLFISPTIPDGGGHGIQRRGANHLRALSECAEVCVRVFKLNYDGRSQIPSDLASFYRDSKIVGVSTTPARLPTSLPFLSFLNELFWPSYRRNMPQRSDLYELSRLINEQEFDAIFCFRLRAAVILEALEQRRLISPGYRKLVDFDDIESVAIEREIEAKGGEAGLEYRQILRLRVQRLRAQEKRFMGDFDCVLVCSHVDKTKLAEKSPNSALEVIPNSVSMPISMLPDYVTEKNHTRILFVGTMSYLPNEDAAIWFVNDILPLIREKTERELSITLVGFDPAPKVQKLGLELGVKVTGGVQSVEPYYRECDLVVSPVRFGGGTRIKILEAFSYQKPVVSTAVGAEGIQVSNGHNVLLAESVREFADAVLELMDDPGLAARIASGGRELVEKHYTSESVSGFLRELI